MRICLIYPPAEHMIRTNVPSVVDDVSGCYPPLGLLYVAGAIEAGGRHEVALVDCVAEGLDDSALEARLRAVAPDVVGVEALTFSIIDAWRVAGLAKRVDSAIKVVMGGPHANLFPEETVGLDGVDFVLLGESESNINPFLDALTDGVGLERVPGIVGRDAAGGIIKGPPNPLIEDLDRIPMPARHLLKPDLYRSVLGRGRRLTTIMSSRGCPARCIFCDRPHLGKLFRSRSAENVVAEMQMCRDRFGIDEFFFYDDTFTIDRQRVFDVCRVVQQRGMRVYWDIRARISTVDREMLEVLHAAGCLRIHFGIESGSPSVLKTMRKGLDLDKARRVFGWCREIGMESLAYFMIGSPGERESEIKETIDYALSIKCDYVHVAVTTPFPGTELYRMGLDSGVLATDYWREFARNPVPGFVPELWEEHFSRDELIGMMFDLYGRFYKRPRYLLRRLARLRSPAELMVKGRAAVGLFRALAKG